MPIAIEGELEPLLQGGTVAKAEDVRFVVSGGTDSNVQTQFGLVAGAVSELNNPAITAVRSQTYTIDDTILIQRSAYIVYDNSSAATFTFASNNVPDNTEFTVFVDNSKNSVPITVVSPSNFVGMTCPRMIVVPGEVREFKVKKDGTTLEITPIGPVVYEFRLTSTDITSNTAINLSDVPSQFAPLFNTPTTGNVDSLVFDANVTGETELRLEGDFNYTGTNGVFGDNTEVSLVPRIDGGDAGQIALTRNVQHLNFSYASAAKTWRVAMTGGQRISLLLTGFSSTVRLIEPSFFFKIVSKAA